MRIRSTTNAGQSPAAMHLAARNTSARIGSAASIFCRLAEKVIISASPRSNLKLKIFRFFAVAVITTGVGAKYLLVYGKLFATARSRLQLAPRGYLPSHPR
jgi:hypothetical protein